MVNRNLIRELELGDELDQELELAMAGTEAGEYSVGASTLAVNSVLMGKVLRVDDEFVLVDVGYKSEGHIPRNEWDEGEPAPQVGDTVKVLLEEFEEISRAVVSSTLLAAIGVRVRNRIPAGSSPFHSPSFRRFNSTHTPSSSRATRTSSPDASESPASTNWRSSSWIAAVGQGIMSVPASTSPPAS